MTDRSLRPAVPGDAPAVRALALDSGLFGVEDVAIVDTLMDAYFGGQEEKGHRCVLAFVGSEPIGVAYAQPAPAADRTWYLTMIAVRSDRKGGGHGSVLLRHVEDGLRSDGQRLLLVETSGLPSFERTRAFYAGCGYDREARVRDFYEDGDDMVVYRKALV